MSAWDLGELHSPGWSPSPAAPTRGRLNLWLITEPINQAEARGMGEAGGLCKQACGAGRKSPARGGGTCRRAGAWSGSARWGPGARGQVGT